MPGGPPPGCAPPGCAAPAGEPPPDGVWGPVILSCRPSSDARDVHGELRSALWTARLGQCAAGLVQAHVQLLQIRKIRREQALDDDRGDRTDAAQSDKNPAQQQDAEIGLVGLDTRV